MQPFEDTEEGLNTGLTFVDLLRRSGEFERAMAECQLLLGCSAATGVYRQVLEYQARLAAAGDTAAHLMEEAAPVFRSTAARIIGNPLPAPDV